MLQAAAGHHKPRRVLKASSSQVRLQLQNIAGGGVIHKYKGPFGTIRTIVAEEGISAPFKVTLASVKISSCSHVGTLNVHCKPSKSYKRTRATVTMQKQCLDGWMDGWIFSASCSPASCRTGMHDALGAVPGLLPTHCPATAHRKERTPLPDHRECAP